MELTIELKTLKKCIQRLSSIPKRSGDLDFTKIVYISTANGDANFAVTGTEDSLRINAPADVIGDGSAMVNFFWLSSIVKGSKSDVTISAGEGKVVVSSEGSSYSQDVYTGSYPFPKLVDRYYIKTSGAKMIRDLEMVRVCRAKGEVAEVFDNINLSSTGKHILIGATDTAQVAVARPIWEVREDFKMNVAIKNSTVDALKKVVAGSEEDVSLTYEGRLIYFKGADFLLVSRLYDEPYPNIYQLLPKTDMFKEVQVSASVLLGCLNRINTVSGEDTRIVFADKRMDLRAYSGEGRESVSTSSVHENEELIVNSKFLEAIVKQFKNEEITIKFGFNTISGIHMLVVHGTAPMRYYLGEMLEV